jgi:hypothetical protein
VEGVENTLQDDNTNINNLTNAYMGNFFSYHGVYQQPLSQ